MMSAEACETFRMREEAASWSMSRSLTINCFFNSEFMKKGTRRVKRGKVGESGGK
jgi:hypothetical protein